MPLVGGDHVAVNEIGIAVVLFSTADNCGVVGPAWAGLSQRGPEVLKAGSVLAVHTELDLSHLGHGELGGLRAQIVDAELTMAVEARRPIKRRVDFI